MYIWMYGECTQRTDLGTGNSVGMVWVWMRSREPTVGWRWGDHDGVSWWRGFRRRWEACTHSVRPAWVCSRGRHWKFCALRSGKSTLVMWHVECRCVCASVRVSSSSGLHGCYCAWPHAFGIFAQVVEPPALRQAVSQPVFHSVRQTSPQSQVMACASAEYFSKSMERERAVYTLSLLAGVLQCV